MLLSQKSSGQAGVHGAAVTSRVAAMEGGKGNVSASVPHQGREAIVAQGPMYRWEDVLPWRNVRVSRFV